MRGGGGWWRAGEVPGSPVHEANALPDLPLAPGVCPQLGKSVEGSRDGISRKYCIIVFSQKRKFHIRTRLSTLFTPRW